jgi:hypothetical protein
MHVVNSESQQSARVFPSPTTTVEIDDFQDIRDVEGVDRRFLVRSSAFSSQHHQLFYTTLTTGGHQTKFEKTNGKAMMTLCSNIVVNEHHFY